MIHARIACRSVVLALLLGLCGAVACFDETVLENQDCATPDDCANNQDCVQTDYQKTLPEPYGWCRPDDDGCADGVQPGCDCAINGLDLCCTGTEVDTLAPYVDGGRCICVFADDMDYFAMPPMSAGGCVTS
jgi:hypothetical protein